MSTLSVQKLCFFSSRTRSQMMFDSQNWMKGIRPGVSNGENPTVATATFPLKMGIWHSHVIESPWISHVYAINFYFNHVPRCFFRFSHPFPMIFSIISPGSHPIWRQAQVSSATGGILASTYGLGAGEATTKMFRLWRSEKWPTDLGMGQYL